MLATRDDIGKALTVDEESALLSCCLTSRSRGLYPAVMLALNSGMRYSEIRLLRDNVVVHTGRVGSLRRFKDDVSEVRTGMECGVTIENFGDIKPGDIIEAYVTEKVTPEVFA